MHRRKPVFLALLGVLTIAVCVPMIGCGNRYSLSGGPPASTSEDPPTPVPEDPPTPVPECQNSGVTTGLIGHWRMDETSGSVVVDSSGFGRDGAAVGTAIVSGRCGNARRGAPTGEHIAIPSETLPATNFTFLMWINLYDNTNEHHLYFHGVQSGCGGSSNWFMASGDVGGTIHLTHGVGCADAQSLHSTGTLNLNQWHLVGYTTDASKRTTVYIDGVAQNAPTDNTAGSSLTTGNDTIGGYWVGGEFHLRMEYSVDEVRMYNRVLTESEIRDLYDNP